HRWQPASANFGSNLVALVCAPVGEEDEQKILDRVYGRRSCRSRRSRRFFAGVASFWASKEWPHSAAGKEHPDWPARKRGIRGVVAFGRPAKSHRIGAGSQVRRQSFTLGAEPYRAAGPLGS